MNFPEPSQPPHELSPEQRKARAELFAPVYARILEIRRIEAAYRAGKITHAQYQSLIKLYQIDRKPNRKNGGDHAHPIP